MSDRVTCGECGVGYDSDTDAFCPRCGSTAVGRALPAALAVARRHDPARRRVQGSGILLTILGGFFLVSMAASYAIPDGDVAQTFVTPLADQPGGTLVLVPPGNRTFDVVITTQDGAELVNQTGLVGPFNFTSPKHASLHVWTALDANDTVTYVAPGYNISAREFVEFDAIVPEGSRLTVPLDSGANGDIRIAGPLAQALQVGRIVFLVLAAILLAGGICAILLRAYALAAIAAIVGALLAALVLVGFLLYGLLFAVPLGIAAVFILGGRRHFRK